MASIDTYKLEVKVIEGDSEILGNLLLQLEEGDDVPVVIASASEILLDEMKRISSKRTFDELKPE